ncbi:MAG: hypothetical protein EOO15_08225 [Chitinophagaceae bacterium]|nr:MAG: hypothetical protein EOO15_08225 [Chitinophagaceae bacterium]
MHTRPLVVLLLAFLFVKTSAQEPRLVLPVGHTRKVTFFSFSPDEQKVLTCSNDNAVKLWDASTGLLLADIRGLGTERYFRSTLAVYAPSGETFATAFPNTNDIQVWDGRTARPTHLLTGHKAPVTSIVYDGEGKRILTTSEDGTARLWSAASGLELRWIRVPAFRQSEVMFNIFDTAFYSRHEALFSADGTRIITSESGGSYVVWNASTGEAISTNLDRVSLKKLLAPVRMPHTALVAEESYAELRPGNGAHPIRLQGSHYVPENIIPSPDGNSLLATYGNGFVKVIDVSSGKMISSFQSGEQINYIQFSPDGSKVVIASNDSLVKIWDVATGSRFANLKVRNFDNTYLNTWNKMYHASFSPDNARLVTAGGDGNVQVFDARTGERLKVLGHHGRRVLYTEFSADGKRFLTASGDGTAKVFDANSFKLLLDLGDHPNTVFSGHFSSNGTRILTESADSSFLWDASNGSLLFRWQGRTGGFSADARKVATISSADKRVRIWNAQTGALQNDFPAKGNGVQFWGNSMVYTEDFGRLKLWHATSGTLIADFVERGTFRYFDARRGRALFSDQSEIRVVNLSDQQLAYSVIVLDSSDYFIHLPTQHYLATANAASALHYVTDDLNVIAFDQLDVRFNRPDLVLKASGSKDESIIKALHRAYQKRVQRLGVDTTLFGANGFGVPTGLISNRPSLAPRQREPNLQVRFTGSDSAFRLDRFNLWVNEVPLYGSKGLSLRQRELHAFDTLLQVPLSMGANKIEASVSNVNGTESFRVPLQVEYVSADQAPAKLYFVGIGLNRFRDAGNDLRYSVKDIRDLAVALGNKYDGAIEIDTLFDSRATLSNVNAIRQKLRQTNINDKVIVAYSGHGLLSKDYDFFLSTYDVNFSKPEEGGLPYEVLEGLLDSIAARQKLMLIDACHSGEVDKEDLQNYVAVETTDKLKKGIELKPDPSKRRMGTKSSFELMQQLFVNVGRSTGATIISAAAGTQFALERGDLQNGVFTYSILEFMKTHPHATVSELKTYVNQRVPELTKGMQVPTSRAENKAVDWSIW